MDTLGEWQKVFSQTLEKDVVICAKKTVNPSITIDANGDKQ